MCAGYRPRCVVRMTENIRFRLMYSPEQSRPVPIEGRWGAFAAVNLGLKRVTAWNTGTNGVFEIHLLHSERALALADSIR
jgi:hypothetical protein